MDGGKDHSTQRKCRLIRNENEHGEAHEEAEEEADDKLFRGFGRTGKETRGQSDRHVEAGNTSNRVPEWSRKARSKTR